MDVLTALRLRQQMQPQVAAAPAPVTAPVEAAPYMLNAWGTPGGMQTPGIMSNTPEGQAMLASGHGQTVSERLASGELSYADLAGDLQGQFAQYAPVERYSAMPVPAGAQKPASRFGAPAPSAYSVYPDDIPKARNVQTGFSPSAFQQPSAPSATSAVSTMLSKRGERPSGGFGGISGAQAGADYAKQRGGVVGTLAGRLGRTSSLG